MSTQSSLIRNNQWCKVRAVLVGIVGKGRAPAQHTHIRTHLRGLWKVSIFAENAQQPVTGIIETDQGLVSFQHSVINPLVERQADESTEFITEQTINRSANPEKMQTETWKTGSEEVVEQNIQTFQSTPSNAVQVFNSEAQVQVTRAFLCSAITEGLPNSGACTLLPCHLFALSVLRSHFSTCVCPVQVLSIMEGADGKLSYVLSQPAADSAPAQALSLAPNVQIVGDASQYPHLQSTVFKVDPEAIEQMNLSSPKKGNRATTINVRIRGVFLLN